MIISESFIKSWFALQRQLIDGLQLAYVDLQGAGVSPGGLIVSFPDDLEACHELALAAQLAQRSGAPVTGMGQVINNGAMTLRIAYPLRLGQHAEGAVVVEVLAPVERQAALLQLLKWGEAWLNLALTQRDEQPIEGGYGRLIDAGMAQQEYHDTLTVVLALLPMRTGCTRVALGRSGTGGVHLEAVSELTEFDASSARVKSIEAAMSEALQTGATVCWPDTDADCSELSRQQELAELAGLRGVCSVPLMQGMRTPLVLCFEFVDGFSHGTTTRATCEEGASIVAPLLELHHEVKQTWWRRLVALCHEGLDNVLREQSRMRRVSGLIAALAIVLFVFSAGEYRVSAPATLEGAVQRALVAPFDGYIVDARVRAGHEVTKGDVLARLDDRDLIGEQRRLRAEQGEFAEQHRQAVATLDHGKAKIIEAQLEQANARLSLVHDQLMRTELRAPVAGLVISGDWSRSLGVPVSRGDLLFEIAPLDEYQLVMQVSDRDIAGLAPGQQGRMTLSALPRQSVHFTVSGISSMAPDQASTPSFRVEATLTNTLPSLRPGMQGVAKVAVGERRRWWIWTHPLTDWLRLHLWRLLP